MREDRVVPIWSQVISARVVLPEGIRYIRVGGSTKSLYNGRLIKVDDMPRQVLNTLKNNNMLDDIQLAETFWVTYRAPDSDRPAVYPRPISDSEIARAIQERGVQVLSKVPVGVSHGE